MHALEFASKVVSAGVLEDHGWSDAVVHPAVSPSDHCHEDGEEVASFFGEAVFAARGVGLVGRLVEDAFGDELGQAFGEDISSEAE